MKSYLVSALHAFFCARPAEALLSRYMSSIAKGATALIVAVILYGSMTPGSTLETVSIDDKIMHILAYGALTVFAVAAFPKRSIWTVALSCLLIGLGLEVAQVLWATGRTGSLFDGLANSFGVTCAVLFWHTVSFRLRSRQNM